MTENWQPATRTKVEAYRAEKGREDVAIIANGENPSTGYRMKIETSPFDIFPTEYILLRELGPGAHAQVVTPYSIVRIVRCPLDQDVIVVHHADGTDRVPIQQAGPGLAGFTRAVAPAARQGAAAGGAATEVTGYSASMSFDEAFADALAHLPGTISTHPDSLVSATVVETGALVGGFAGFHHLYVRIRGGRD